MPTPGAMRPQTFADVLGVINNQGGTPMDANGPVVGIGNVVEANEAVVTSDSVTLSVTATPGWDTSVWGLGQWS